MKITDLDFGYMQFDPNTGELTRHNIFSNVSVMRSVAQWVTMSSSRRKAGLDPISFCFIDYWSRCQYEFVIKPWVGEGEEQKVDIWTMYVVPNKDILFDMIDKVSVNSAREWLREERKKYASKKSK